MKISMKFALSVILFFMWSIPFSAWAQDTNVERNSLMGEWFFAMITKDCTGFLAPAPPTFDIVSFDKQGGANLVSTLQGQAFGGEFALTKNLLTLRFSVPEQAEPIELQATISVSPELDKFTMSVGCQEYIYIKESRLLNHELVGSWVVSGESPPQRLHLADDGLYLLEWESQTLRGYYRAWKSQRGETMLMLGLFDPEHGAYASLQQYEHTNDTLTMRLVMPTPLTEEEKNQVVWELEK